MRRCLLVLGLFSSTYFVSAQKPMSIKMKDPVICYAAETDNPLIIPAPAEYLRWKDKAAARTKSATIEVNYIGFPVEAQAAFQAAVDIWENLISSPVTIRIEARWVILGANVLGSALYTSAYANFEGAQKLNVYYPVSIAEKITGQELNNGEADLFAQFNSNFNWHFDPNTTPASGQYDLITVVLHEIGHGLGFAGTFSYSNGEGEYGLFGSSAPIIYDVHIENGSGFNLIETYTSPSDEFGGQLVSADLFFDSPTTGRPKLYAPNTFSGGSSISHLDETTFNGTDNSLMTPRIAPMEKMHDPGIALNILKDIGWETVKIDHDPLQNTENENGPYTVTALISADKGYKAPSVKLNYTLNGLDFINVGMTPTGLPDEFTFTIPATGEPQMYAYYISVEDTDGTEFVNPGKIVSNNNPQTQFYYVFETGPDIKSPTITHNPKPFLLESDIELAINAKVTDNIGIASVTLEYFINDQPQPNQSFTLSDPAEDSIYLSTISFGPLANGDSISYRIVAIDNSSNTNQGFSPANGYHKLYVVGLSPTQANYQNDFNSPSNDFFGNGFTITTPAGFNNPAIHTTHPYPEGQGFQDNRYNYIYQLKIPILVKETDATIKFDEIVLVEPGEPGSVFPNEDFYDYVVVEGSKDGGINWEPVANGYDSRSNSAWLTRYNSAISSGNSTATGDPSLYITRTFDLLQKFEENDEVVIRFRLYSDPGAAGWGWSIDNLKIQIDETPPLVLHDHLDYFKPDQDLPALPVKVSDLSVLEDVVLTFRVNADEITGNITASDVTSGQTIPFALPIGQLDAGDMLEYRISTMDEFGNVGSFPANGFIQVPIFEFDEPVTTYSNNFNTATSDFAGNFFSIEQPDGFSNPAIHSNHFYDNGIGLNNTSYFTYILKKPITISDQNSFIRFDEIALVQGQASDVPFGTDAFNDYVIVEGSKDGGITWNTFLDGYDIVGQPLWTEAFNAGANPSSALYRTRSFDMTANGNFSASDEVIIRFRLFADETVSGWGWVIDNLYIQDPITSTEKELESAISVYPNPTRENITVEASGLTSPEFTIQLLNAQGQTVYAGNDYSVNGKMTHLISASTLVKGLYFVKISNERNTIIRKIAKVD